MYELFVNIVFVDMYEYITSTKHSNDHTHMSTHLSSLAYGDACCCTYRTKIAKMNACSQSYILLNSKQTPT